MIICPAFKGMGAYIRPIADSNNLLGGILCCSTPFGISKRFPARVAEFLGGLLAVQGQQVPCTAA